MATNRTTTAPALAKLTPVARARHARRMAATATTLAEKARWVAEARRWEAK